jgi:hypothetical protein
MEEDKQSGLSKSLENDASPIRRWRVGSKMQSPKFERKMLGSSISMQNVRDPPPIPTAKKLPLTGDFLVEKGFSMQGRATSEAVPRSFLSEQVKICLAKLIVGDESACHH